MKKRAYFIVPFLKRYDATGDYLLAQANLFRRQGYDVYICALNTHPNVQESVLSYKQFNKACTPDDVVIYHYGIYDSGYNLVKNACAQHKVFYYHNQTPPVFF